MLFSVLSVMTHVSFHLFLFLIFPHSCSCFKNIAVKQGAMKVHEEVKKAFDATKVSLAL